MTLNETVLFVTRPAMFRDEPLRFLFYVLLIPIVVGAVLLIVWWLRCRTTALTITDKRTTLSQGVFSRHTSEVLHADVTNLQVDQTFFQRLAGTGTIEISSSAQDDIEIILKGISHPQKVADLIRERMT